MKRFLLIGTVFFTAALFGLGIALFLPANAAAGVCLPLEVQHYVQCPSLQCPPHAVNAAFHCGTDSATGEPCDCYLESCTFRCLDPI